MNAEPELDDVLNRSFRLVCLFVDDSRRAFKVVFDAVESLTVQTIRFRNKVGSARRSGDPRSVKKLSLGQAHLLQYLLFIESELAEREQEQSDRGRLNRTTLALRFIKFVVKSAWRRPCLHMTVGLMRIIHRYNTDQLEQVYDVLTESYKDGFRDESRRAKGRLIRDLQKRFETYIETVTIEQNEIRFRPASGWQPPPELIYDCLELLRPWETACITVIPDAFARKHERFGIEAQEELERLRIHASVCPDCFEHLTRETRMDPPRDMLDLPQFAVPLLPQDPGGPGPVGGRMGLTPDELDQLKKSLQRQESLRKLGSHRLLRIRANGRDCATLDLSSSAPRVFRLPAGADILKIYAASDGDEVLLASHLIEYDEDGRFVTDRASVTLGGARRVDVLLTPDQSGDNASVSISYREGWLFCALPPALADPLEALRLRVRIGAHGARPLVWVPAAAAVVFMFGATWLCFDWWRERVRLRTSEASNDAQIRASQQVAADAGRGLEQERRRSRYLEEQVTRLEQQLRLEKQRPSETGQELAAVEGGADKSAVFVLDAGIPRGNRGARQLLLREGVDTVILKLRHRHEKGVSRAVVSISTPGGPELWSDVVSTTTAGFLSFRMPGKLWSPGPYIVKLTPVDSEGVSLDADYYAFEIVAAPETRR